MFQHIKKLLLGNGLAQAIQLMSLLALSRLYPPSDFGVLAHVQAIATFSTIVATLQLHLATPLSQSEDEARTLTSHTQSIALLFTLALLIPALLLGRIETYSLWLTLAIALINTYSGYLIYRGEFSAISRFYVTRASLVVLFQLLFAFLDVEDALILSTLLAETLAALYLMKVGLNHRPALCPKPRLLLKSARQHKPFSLYGTSQELVSVTAFYAPLIYFGVYFDPTTAGQYAMASRLVWAPTVLISRNIAQVAYHASAQSKTIQIEKIRKFLINQKTLASLPLILISIYYSEHVAKFALGSDWLLAGEIIPTIAIWALFFLIATPFRVLYRTLKLQKLLLAFDCALLAAITAAFFTIESISSIVTTIAGTAAALQTGTILFIYYKIKALTTTSNN